MSALKILVGVMLLAIAASCSSTEDSRALRDDWIPALEQIADHFEAHYESGVGQWTASVDLAWTRDAQMLIAYVHLWQWLGPAERAALRQEQDAWNRTAHEEADKAGKEYEGGTLEHHLRSRTYAELACARTRELRSRLKAIRGAAYVDPATR